METFLIVLIALALVFDFLNGMHDLSNIVATIISSRSLSPRKALAITAIAEFSGPFLFGVAVAKTIGAGLVDPSSITEVVILSLMCSAIIWNLATWFFGIPSSSSHALIGGIIGSVAASIGFQEIILSGLTKVLIALFLSPVVGLVAGFLLTRLVYFLARGASPRINFLFKNGQVLTGIALALSHGTNDAQKTMGIITLGLVVTGFQEEFIVPIWVVAISAGAIALGTLTGGWRLIKTLGGKFYKIRPVHGFCSQISSAAVIMGAALLGGPVSTTQVVSSAILGVGSAHRVNMVRWGSGNIAMAWLITIPATGLLGAIFFWLFSLFL